MSSRAVQANESLHHKLTLSSFAVIMHTRVVQANESLHHKLTLNAFAVI